MNILIGVHSWLVDIQSDALKILRNGRKMRQSCCEAIFLGPFGGDAQIRHPLNRDPLICFRQKPIYLRLS